MVCSRITTAAAMTIGSMHASGREPWPPRPYRVTLIESEVAKAAPGCRPIIPAGIGPTCCPSTTSGRPKRSKMPSATIARAPVPSSSAGWATTISVPAQESSAASSAAAPSRQVTWTSWPQACITGTSVPFGSVPRAVLA